MGVLEESPFCQEAVRPPCLQDLLMCVGFWRTLQILNVVQNILFNTDSKFKYSKTMDEDYWVSISIDRGVLTTFQKGFDKENRSTWVKHEHRSLKAGCKDGRAELPAPTPSHQEIILIRASLS